MYEQPYLLRTWFYYTLSFARVYIIWFFANIPCCYSCGYCCCFSSTGSGAQHTTMSSKPTSLKDADVSPSSPTESRMHNGVDTPSTILEEKEPVVLPEWKPSARLYVAFLTLAVITLMVALDGTSLSVALPVGS